MKRPTKSVTCKECSTVYEKRTDTLANWSGYCRTCTHKVITNKDKFRNRRACASCGKVSYWIQKSDYCKDCDATVKGADHYNWKGGVTEASKYLRSKFLKYTHPKVLARDNYTCQICSQYGGNLQVDHIKSWSEYPELRFDMNNCRTVCMGCHYYITFKRKMPKGTVWGHNLSRRITS